MLACAEQNLEGLAGTAPEQIQNWILVEYSKGWSERVNLDTIDVSAKLKQKLQLKMKKEGWKILLIRKPKSSGSLIYWSSRAGIFQAEQTGDWSWEPEDSAWKRVSHPLILVCTHGKRDQCCGIRGGQVFSALHARKPDWVWQSSHLGGHRFAPTLLTLPDGMMYGRVPVEESEELVDYLARGEQWHIEYRRGSTRLLQWQQVLQMWLEEEDLYGEVFLDIRRQRAYIDTGDVTYGVEISYQVLGTCIPSCGDKKTKEIGEWVVTGIETID